MRQRLAFGAVAAACFGLAAVTSLSTAFTGRPTFDDEGYILISLRGWMSGHALYDAVYSQYGPAYYVLVGGPLRLVGQTMVSFEAARAITVALTLVSATGLAYATARISKSPVAGLLAGACVAVWWPTEAALHPTHLVGLLVVAAVVGVSILDDSPKSMGAAILVGAAVAMALLVKINVGVFLAVSVAAGLGLTTRSAHARALLIAPLALAVGVAAAALAGDYRSSFVALLSLAAFVTIVGAGSVTTVLTSAQSRVHAVAAAIAAGVVIVATALLTGTSFGGMAKGVVFEPTHLSRAFTFEMSGGRLSLVAVAVVASGILVDGRASPALRGVVRIGTGAIFLLALYEQRYGSGLVHGVNLLVLAASLGWVILRTNEQAIASSRVVICSLALTLPLGVYPVAGAQRAAAALVLPVAAAVAITDGLNELRPVFGWRREVQIKHLATIGLGMAALLVGVAGVGKSHSARSRAVPLAVVPTSHIRTTPGDARDTAAVTSALSQCPTFYGIPGLNSFYFFADKVPPTWQNTATWMTLFDESRQAQVVRALKQVDGLCVLRNGDLEAGWLNSGDERPGPLRPYLESFTRLVAESGDYEIYRAP